MIKGMDFFILFFDSVFSRLLGRQETTKNSKDNEN